VYLNIPDFFQNATIERLARFLEQKHRVRPEPQVVPLQTGHTGLPLYFIGAGPEEYRIAQSIGENRAVFAVDVPMREEWHHAIIAANRAALPSIEQLGALYGDVLRANVVGSSPYVIAGYSYWGRVAFEAARALHRGGGNVAFVIILDTAFRGRTWYQAWESLLLIWRSAATGAANGTPYTNGLSTSIANSWRLLRWLIARMPLIVKRRLAVTGRFILVDREDKPVEQVLLRFKRMTEKSFHPRPLDASGVLIRTKLTIEELLPGLNFSLGWRDLFARGIEIIRAAGDHNSMVGDKNVAALARQINAVLDRHDLCKTKENRRAS